MSLLSTLFIFQSAMVWKVDESGELGKTVEKGAIGLILATCVLALQTQWYVYRKHVTQQSGSSGEVGAVWDNPMLAIDEADTMISVTFTEDGSLGIRLEPNSESGLIELVGIDAGSQAAKHSQLREGLMLHGVEGLTVTDTVSAVEDVRSMSLKQQQELLQSVHDSRPIRLVFTPWVMGASDVNAVSVVEHVSRATEPVGSLRSLISQMRG
eukprot:COSAG01_NODE_14765_length_1413_cov_1.608828_1_plen_211_part_00